MNDSTSNFSSAFKTFLKQIRFESKRACLLVSGSAEQRHEIALQLLLLQNAKQTAWISAWQQNLHPSFHASKPAQLIGKEYDAVVFDLESDFSPNLLAAVSGTIIGGGVLYLLSPDMNAWLKQLKNENLYLHRLLKILSVHDHVYHFNASKPHLSLSKDTGTLTQFTPDYTDQLQAINEILHVSSGHRNRPLVILADRGRGKSAALGLAAASLFLEKQKKIIFTAPSYESCTIAFKHIKKVLPEAYQNRNKFADNNGRIEFIAPDELQLNLPKADLLIIDEAAAIPTAILINLIKNYSRVVLASTVHGYEGTGHALEKRLFKSLEKLCPGWKKIYLHKPLRWSQQDSLEKLISQLFLLDAEADSVDEIQLDKLEISLMNKSDLISNEQELKQLYALFKSAHYKTQPSDLEILFNNELNIFAARIDKTLIGAICTVLEGDLDKNIIDDIQKGLRRPKGHLLPQSLIVHQNIADAWHAKIVRVMRIAVLPEFQRKGVGKKLIEHIENFYQSENIDLFGCSFGLTEELFDFWQSSQYIINRVGHTRNNFSGAHAAHMLKPASPLGDRILNQACQHFMLNFPFQLRGSLNQLETELVIRCLGQHYHSLSISEHSVETVRYFMTSNAQFEDFQSEIFSVVLFALSHKQYLKQCEPELESLLIQKVLQNKPWEDLDITIAAKGRQEFQNILKTGLQKLSALF